MQNPGSAADELERAVSQLGFKGALINGYSNIGPDESVCYLDEETVWEFWDRVSKLNVPVYLHHVSRCPANNARSRVIRNWAGIA